MQWFLFSFSCAPLPQLIRLHCSLKNNTLTLEKLSLSKIYCTSSNDVKFGEKVGLRNAKLVHQAPRILVTSGFFQQ